ncbi:MAG: transglutaminase-like domain-containing protein [Clostridia bacterium]|nr:transglutaminase-like domain-containing protein [Clostridia bacterium]
MFKNLKSKKALSSILSLSLILLCAPLAKAKYDTPRNPEENRIIGITEKEVNETYMAEQIVYFPKTQTYRIYCRANNGLGQRTLFEEECSEKEYCKELELKIREILHEMNDRGYKTDFEKAVFLHDYICNNCKYNWGTLIDARLGFGADYFGTDFSYKAYGCLICKSAVCSGIAKAYRLLMTRAGVKCKYISGGTPRGAHAWNIVRINGEWYHVDVCSDLIWKAICGKYKWFMLTEKEISQDHDSFKEEPVALSHQIYIKNPKD